MLLDILPRRASRDWPGGRTASVTLPTAEAPSPSPRTWKGSRSGNPDKMRLDTFKTLGSSPMPINFGELYTALQQGVVDAQENPLAIIASSAFYEVQKYLSLSGHIWGSALLCVNNSVWNKLSDADKTTVERLAVKWRDEERRQICLRRRRSSLF